MASSTGGHWGLFLLSKDSAPRWTQQDRQRRPPRNGGSAPHTRAKPYQIWHLLKLVEEHALALEDSDVKDAHINVFWSDQDACYVAAVPNFPHCSAFGPTPEVAVHEVIEAREAWLEAAHEAGKPIPRPGYRPAIYQAAR